LLQKQNEGAQRSAAQRGAAQSREEAWLNGDIKDSKDSKDPKDIRCCLQLCFGSFADPACERLPACLPASLCGSLLCFCIRALTTSQHASSQEQKLPVNASRGSVLPEHSTLSSNLPLTFDSRCSFNFVIAEAAGLLQTLGAAELCPHS
jgi:hypothetical protein